MLPLRSMCLHHVIALVLVYLAYFSLRQMFRYSFDSILKCLPAVLFSLLDNSLMSSRLLRAFLWGCLYRKFPEKWLLIPVIGSEGKDPECARDYKETEQSL